MQFFANIKNAFSLKRNIYTTEYINAIDTSTEGAKQSSHKKKNENNQLDILMLYSQDDALNKTPNKNDASVF